MSYLTDHEYKLQNRISQEIDKVRQEMHMEFLKKDSLDLMLGRFQSDLVDKGVNRK